MSELEDPDCLATSEHLQAGFGYIFTGVRLLRRTDLVPLPLLIQFERSLTELVVRIGLDPTEFSEAALRVDRRIP